MNTLPSSGSTMAITTREDGARDNLKESDMMEILALLARGPVAAPRFAGKEAALRRLLETQAIVIDQGGTYHLAVSPTVSGAKG